jgi:tryptophan-rich hypothetical protein
MTVKQSHTRGERINDPGIGLSMNKLNPRKLLNSKWTAVKPVNKEKHFLVTEVEFDEDGRVIHCLIEAVLTCRSSTIDWRSLRDSDQWLCGWV